QVASYSALSAAVAGLLGSVGGGGRGLLGKADFELLLDLVQVFRLGLELARVRPLKPRLERPPGLPIGVAEVIVDGRVVGLELDRALQALHRLVVGAEPLVRRAHSL